MAMNLRKAVIRSAAVATVFCFVLSMGLSLLTHGWQVNLAALGWPLVLALGVGLFSGWHTTVKIREGVLNAIPRDFAFLQLERGQPFHGVDIDWNTIDDYAIQLEARGYSRLGEFTTWPVPRHFVGIASCYVNATTTTLVEVQHIRMDPSAPPGTSGAGGIHFSIVSQLGGAIRACSTDHTAMATHYLMRDANDVVATFPGLGLLALLDKHARLVATIQEKTGKSAAPGFTMARYVLSQRERFAHVRKRLESLSGFAIAKQIDAFEADPRSNWSPPSARLAALPDRPLSDLDKSSHARGKPLIVTDDTDQSPAAAAGTAGAAGVVRSAAADDGRRAALREQVNRGASWFFWIAGLSLVNTVIGIAGSDWAFVLGVGVAQIMTASAAELRGADASTISLLALWGASLALSALFGVCGWLAKAPSTAAFAIGTILFALDTLIFVIALDAIGIVFHALVLYFLWKGWSAARAYRALPE